MLAPSAVCDLMRDQCVACGGDGQACCVGGVCDNGGCCVAGTGTCIGSGNACTSGASMAGTCTKGGCSGGTCGEIGQACCADPFGCTSPYSECRGGTCAECGGHNEVCCGGFGGGFGACREPWTCTMGTCQ